MFARIPNSSVSPEIDFASRSMANGSNAVSILSKIVDSHFNTIRHELGGRKFKVRIGVQTAADSNPQGRKEEAEIVVDAVGAEACSETRVKLDID
jgi:hypothetical protein